MITRIPAFEATPILVNNLLYLSTPTNIVIALDPGTGKQRWRYDPRIPRDVHYSEAASRGVASWIDPAAPPATLCSHRIYIGTLDARLLALDGISGHPCESFGKEGTVDLSVGVRMTKKGDYLVTSPPAIVRVCVGSAVSSALRLVRMRVGLISFPVVREVVVEA